MDSYDATTDCFRFSALQLESRDRPIYWKSGQKQESFEVNRSRLKELGIPRFEPYPLNGSNRISSLIFLKVRCRHYYPARVQNNCKVSS